MGSDDLNRINSTPIDWSRQAKLGELRSVLSPNGSERRNKFIHSVHLFGGRKAIRLTPASGVILDFGCGTGRFMRFFGKNGYKVIGTDITPEMLSEAQRIGLPGNATIIPTDGVHISVPDQSVDTVWCCGVLRFALFSDEPTYREIAKEMYRVLKPFGFVVNIEAYVDGKPETFADDFEDLGFTTREVRVLERHFTRFENLCQSRRLPVTWVNATAKLCATYRYWFDSGVKPGLRDYLFVWQKSC